jgi:outer membrane protein assembly factor BamE
MIKLYRAIWGCCLALLLAGCSYLPTMPTLSSLRVYRIDVQQGNVTTQDMVSQLKPGMTKEQVKFIMGSPLLTDMFHASRWDYVYRFQHGKDGKVEERHLTLYFDKEALARIEGDVVPGTPPVATADKPVADSDRAKTADAAADKAKAADAAAAKAAPDQSKAAEAAADQPAPPKGFFARLREKLGL